MNSTTYPAKSARPAAAGRAGVSRAIGRHHFAFFRGYLLGLDLRLLAERYLEPDMDFRRVKSTLGWLRAELLMAARRQQRYAWARVIGLPPGALPPDPAPDWPSLEDFRLQRDPEGFYGEAELIELYRHEFGDPAHPPPNPAPDSPPHPIAADSRAIRRARRNERLRQRQLDALKWLETLVATDPQPDDALEAWFEPALARRLHAAGFDTLRSVAQAINRHGLRWWTRVERLGEKGAGRVLAWLQRHQPELGLALQAQTLVPRRSLDAGALGRARAAQTAVVPLEHFLLPQALDGSAGTNRAPASRNRLAAGNDLEALHAWLRTVAANPHTRRAYRREAERILLWAIVHKQKPLSALDMADCVEYRDFLADPQPAPQWCGPRNAPRWSEQWRPFEGPLAPRSRAGALTILRALFEWLTRTRYLETNPWDGVPRHLAAATSATTADPRPGGPRRRSLSRRQWQQVAAPPSATSTAAAPATDEAALRLRFVLAFAYGTGLRLSELVAARSSQLAQLGDFADSADGPRWMLDVLGKGGKWRRVPFPAPLFAALETYFTARGLPAPPQCPAETPLIARLSDHPSARLSAHPGAAASQALSPSALYKLLKKHFAAVAGALRQSGRAADTQHLLRASTHWLRHTCGSHAVDSGVPIHVVQQIFGHASLATTTLYIAAEEEKAYQEMARFLNSESQPL